MSLREMAEKTPADRDRYVDFLRAFSIATVVFGHWFIALIWWKSERIGVYNAVGATSGLWLATWVLQVMPLFFFVGGFSNAKTYDAARRKDDSYGDFMRARAGRLLKPTAIFIGAWLFVQIGLHLADLGGTDLIRLTFLPFGPLWFLFVYMGVVALTPITLALHKHFGAAVSLTLLAGIIAIDSARFGFDIEGVGWGNLALVWLLAHQLGYHYADGSLERAGTKLHAAMALAGLAGLIVLTNIGVYPRSMVGTDVEAVSNMNPPTVCIAALTIWLIGAAMLIREPMRRWLGNTKPWMAVIAANGIIMTVFLWHLTAYVITILLLYPLGLGHPEDSTLSWWLQRPLWLAAPAIVLAGLVALFGRFERPARR
jgi:Acyltransferase family